MLILCILFNEIVKQFIKNILSPKHVINVPQTLEWPITLSIYTNNYSILTVNSFYKTVAPEINDKIK